MPFLVQNLMQGRPAPVTVRREDSVMRALDLMIEHDFSQLPVVGHEDKPLGMVTYEGIMRGIRNFRTQLDNLRVRDVITPAQSFSLYDSLFDMLEQLKATNAVLIVEFEGNLVGIVTSYDSTEYFRSRAEDLMHVEDIEIMVKEFIRLAYAKDDRQTDEARLAEAIARVTQRENGSDEGRRQSFDDLSLGQYTSLLIAKQTWSFFEPIFGLPRDAVRVLLDDVRNTRNDLAHFRREISAHQTDQLRFCASWLAGCREEYDQKQSEIWWDTHGMEDLLEEVKPMASDLPPVKVNENDGKLDQTPDTRSEVRVIAEESQPGNSRYSPLADWFTSQPGQVDIVRLSFKEIEAIIGGDLPTSAHTHRAWWSNDAQSHPQSRLWLEAGWRTSYLNMTEKRVTFTRIRERERAYIDFYSKLLTELRQQASFTVRDVSPDGTNWVVCRTINEAGLTVGQFNYSFARSRRFRVELYIDAFERGATKQIFDRLYQHKDALEATLGELSWERIDGKRASRIAKYCLGDIEDSEAQLTALRQWAVEKMIAFFNALEPLASQAIHEVLAA